MRDDLDIPMPAMGPAASGGSYRVPRQREGTDTNTRRLAMIAAGIGGTLVVLLGAWSLTGHRRTGVPVVEADARPVREKPTNAGGMQVAGKDEAILSGKADGQAALAPPAEAPRPDALKAQEKAAAAAVPAASTAQPPAAMASSPSTAIGPVAMLPSAARPPATAAQLAPPASAAKPAVSAAPNSASAASPKPAVVAAAPTPAPAVTAPVAAKPPARPGNAQVQLAAVGSEQAALQEWQRLEKKAPALFGGHKPLVSKTERDGKTFWRLRATGFADSTAAKGFCEQAKTKGLACTVMAL